jgi:hypothetical protein
MSEQQKQTPQATDRRSEASPSTSSTEGKQDSQSSWWGWNPFGGWFGDGDTPTEHSAQSQGSVEKAPAQNSQGQQEQQSSAPLWRRIFGTAFG